MKTITTLIRNSGIFNSDSSSGYSCDSNGIKSNNVSQRDSKLEAEMDKIILYDEPVQEIDDLDLMDAFEELSWSDLAVDMSLVSTIL